MKTTLALTTLSAKLAMLLCVSCVGLFGLMQDSFAADMPPCHQEMVQEDEANEPCEMCETAMEAWEENAVAASETVLTKTSELEFAVGTILQNFEFELKPFEGVYQAYYPPPQVLLKAVTPNTKTIVLLS